MIPFLLPTLAWLAACSPAWNWREVRLEDAPLTAMLPCKPDQASQTVTLAGATAELQMTGCESGGASLSAAWPCPSRPVSWPADGTVTVER